MNKITDTLRTLVAKSDSEINGDQARLVLDLAKVFSYKDDEAFNEQMQEFRQKYSYGISVGDECFYSINPEWKFIVSRIYFDGNKFFFDGIDKNGLVISNGSLNAIEKTGNYYSIKRFLEGTFE